MLLVGDSFFETSEDDATEHCEAEVERMQKEIDRLETDEEKVAVEKDALKKVLYTRFGKSIQLEEK